MYVNQPTSAPTNKVAAAGLGGAVSILVVYLASLFNIVVPPEVASAFTTIAAFASGYLTKEKMT